MRALYQCATPTSGGNRPFEFVSRGNWFEVDAGLRDPFSVVCQTGRSPAIQTAGVGRTGVGGSSDAAKTQSVSRKSGVGRPDWFAARTWDSSQGYPTSERSREEPWVLSNAAKRAHADRMSNGNITVTIAVLPHPTLPTREGYWLPSPNGEGSGERFRSIDYLKNAY